MKKWKIVSHYSPPVDQEFWGYHVPSGNVYVCSWDGKRINDDLDPFPKAIKLDHDYSIEYWMEIENSPTVLRRDHDYSPEYYMKTTLMPSPPNVDIKYYKAQERSKAGYKVQYTRLLNAVDTKYPGESRHDTVLRYIRERESSELEQRAAKTINKNNHPNWKAKLKE